MREVLTAASFTVMAIWAYVVILVVFSLPGP
jgi:hypothetical protein